MAREIFLPLTVGGGIREEADAAAAIDAGADKVSLNTAALRDPALITRLAARYGSQAVIVAIDAKRADRSIRGLRAERHRATTATPWNGRAKPPTAAPARSCSRRSTAMGPRPASTAHMTAAVSTAVPIPVIASGGAGTFEHFADVFTAGRADAALAASIFHFNEKSVSELKAFLAAREIPVRLTNIESNLDGDGRGLKPRPYRFSL